MEKSNRNKKKKPLTRAQILKALENQKWDYRTAQGLAAELKLSEQQVKQFVNSDPSVRKSVMKDNQGRSLYTLKKRKSKVGDYFAAFRAMNAAKMGG